MSKGAKRCLIISISSCVIVATIVGFLVALPFIDKSIKRNSGSPISANTTATSIVSTNSQGTTGTPPVCACHQQNQCDSSYSSAGSCTNTDASVKNCRVKCDARLDYTCDCVDPTHVFGTLSVGSTECSHECWAPDR